MEIIQPKSLFYLCFILFFGGIIALIIGLSMDKSTESKRKNKNVVIGVSIFSIVVGILIYIGLEMYDANLKYHYHMEQASKHFRVAAKNLRK